MLQELNKQSLLLLYAADELSAKDRAEVDAMLAADMSLRLELDEIKSAAELFEEGMVRLDALALSSETRACRQIGQAMRQRITERLAAEAAPSKAERGRVRYPLWTYPGVAAAIVLLAFVSWWGHRPDTKLALPSNGPVQRDTNLPAGLQSTTQFADDSTTPDPANAKAVAGLEAAEDQVAELSRSRDDFNFSTGSE